MSNAEPIAEYESRSPYWGWNRVRVYADRVERTGKGFQRFRRWEVEQSIELTRLTITRTGHRVAHYRRIPSALIGIGFAVLTAYLGKSADFPLALILIVCVFAAILGYFGFGPVDRLRYARFYPKVSNDDHTVPVIEGTDADSRGPPYDAFIREFENQIRRANNRPSDLKNDINF